MQELLAGAGLARESTLDTVEARLESDPRFASLPDSLDMDRVFADVMEVRVPEFDFWDLLRECRSPPLTRDTTWGQARRQVTCQHVYKATCFMAAASMKHILSAFRATFACMVAPH